MCLDSGQIFAIIVVIQLPPIESFNICVNLDCRNCTNGFLGSDNPITACSKNDNDLFIYCASF